MSVIMELLVTLSAVPDVLGNWFLVFVFILGTIIGSFLNVFIYRFHTGKSLGGSSHCLSCRTPLLPYELVPLLSYVALRGRCRTCSAKIPSRYFLVELGTGLLFVLAVSALPPVFWPLGMVLVCILMVTLVYDLYHMVIPDEFVLALVMLLAVQVGYLTYSTLSYAPIIAAGGGAVVGFLFFYSLWWYSGGRWIGFGDAKLAVPLGGLVGLTGTFSMIVLSFWIGTAIALSLIAVQRASVWRRGQLRLRFPQERLTIQSEVPFAPFLIMGFLAVYLYGWNVLTLFSA